MTDQEILETLQRVVQTVIEGDNIVLTAKTKFEDFGISSFGMVQLVCAIEDEFDIEIPNSAVKKMKSVKDIMDYLSKHANV